MFRRIKGSKYGAQRVEVDGVRFASKAESERYKTLKEAERRGIIRNLQLQPRFTLLDKFECRGEKIRAIEYVADFKYDIPCDEVIVSSVGFSQKVSCYNPVVEDVKGMILPEFKLKLKLWKRLHGDTYEFRIVKGMKEIRTIPS